MPQNTTETLTVSLIKLSGESISQQFQTSLYLGATKALLVPATQPLQVIMRKQQSALYADKLKLSFSQSFSSIVTHSPRLLGMPTALFRGSASAMTKEAVKNATYKAAYYKGAPKLATTLLYSPEKSEHPKWAQHFMISLMAAGIAGFSDSVLGGPFERLATYQATAVGNQGHASFLTELENKGSRTDQLRFIYQGSGANFIKTVIACFALFACAGPIERRISHSLDLQPGDPIPVSVSGLTALTTGAAVALFSSPFDIVKTIKQMPYASASHDSTWTILKANYQRFGLGGVTAGLPIKMLMTVIGWGTVSAITQQSRRVREDHEYQHSFSR